MSHVGEILDEIRGQIAADDEVLGEARVRRDAVLGYALGCSGALRSFRSGSLAHGTVNRPVSDADCGVVLDRRSYPELGPDGEGEAPNDIVEDLRCQIRDLIKKDYPDALFRVTKRAITITFNEPLLNQDPTVDLIVGLARKDAPGLWIPNTEQKRWDPAHPEEHTRLLVGASKDTKSVFARAVRLAKAWNQQYSNPAFCSFNIEALALGSITDKTSLEEAVEALFEFAATDVAARLTPDPAGVCSPIRLLVDKDIAVKRLRTARDHFQAAMEAESEDDARTELSAVFYSFVDAPEGKSKESIAAQLRRGNATAAGVFATASVKTTKAFGER
jgi:hypothetical protein